MTTQGTDRHQRNSGRITDVAAGMAIALMTLHAANVRADDADTDVSIFSFNGFGTVGVVHSSEDQADFVSNVYQPKGPGFSRRWSATPDSKLGGQVTATFNDKLSAVVQFVSQYQYDATFTPYLEWCNVKYQFTPDFNVRVGRIALPTYMYSDSLNVGYTLPYVRIPLEIYAQLPIARSDGVDTTYRFQIGDATNTVQAFVGSYDSKAADGTPGGIVFNIRDLRGVADTIEYGAATLHLSYQKLNFTYGSLVVNGTQEIMGIGASYDPGQWFVLGERIKAPDNDEGVFHGWYVIGGYRVGKFAPYVGYARAYMVNSSVSAPIIDQDTSTAGIRWDFTKNADLKLQFDHVRRHGGPNLNLYFVNQQPDFKAENTINLFSLAVDFVF